MPKTHGKSMAKLVLILKKIGGIVNNHLFPMGNFMQIHHTVAKESRFLKVRVRTPKSTTNTKNEINVLLQIQESQPKTMLEKVMQTTQKINPTWIPKRQKHNGIHI